jgi:hypothetical protein
LPCGGCEVALQDARFAIAPRNRDAGGAAGA